MPRTDPFIEHTDQYEEWFETFEPAYESEVAALQSIQPESNRGIEVGVGSGRFAEPLGIEYGIDPARDMLDHAIDRGIGSVMGVAEALPFEDDIADQALIVTTICFVDDLLESLRETARVLEPGGSVLLGYIDKESRVGEHYQEIKDENPFYRDATFYSTDSVLDALDSVGFEEREIRQTIFQMPDEMVAADPVRDGYGDGSFVALRAEWPGQ